MKRTIDIDQKREVTLPVNFRLPKSKEMERYTLRVLDNGLPVCQVKLFNTAPLPENKSIVCTALMDTGSECSLLSKDLAKDLQIEKDDLLQAKGISTLVGKSEPLDMVLLRIFVPQQNWSPMDKYFIIKEFDERNEYQVILGTDILKEFNLIYQGQMKLARIEM